VTEDLARYSHKRRRAPKPRLESAALKAVRTEGSTEHHRPVGTPPIEEDMVCLFLPPQTRLLLVPSAMQSSTLTLPAILSFSENRSVFSAPARPSPVPSAMESSTLSLPAILSIGRNMFVFSCPLTEPTPCPLIGRTVCDGELDLEASRLVDPVRPHVVLRLPASARLLHRLQRNMPHKGYQGGSSGPWKGGGVSWGPAFHYAQHAHTRGELFIHTFPLPISRSFPTEAGLRTRANPNKGT
jgi:hypothetical protein